MTKTLEKVYCKDCKYLRETLHPTEGFVVERDCKALMSGENTYLEIEIYYGDPEKQNKNNDCEYYKRKWWKIWN